MKFNESSRNKTARHQKLIPIFHPHPSLSPQGRGEKKGPRCEPTRNNQVKNATILCFLFWLTVCSLHASEKPYEQKGKFLYFHGKGEVNLNIDNDTQRKSLAQEAAILDAKAKIAFYIDELKTKKNVLIKEAKQKNIQLKKKVSAFLKQIEIVKIQWSEEGACIATLRVNKKYLLKKLKAKETH